MVICTGCIFSAIKLTKNTTAFVKYKYPGYGTAFDAFGSFLLSNGSGFGKNAIIFGGDMSSSEHIDNRKKKILIFDKGLVQGLDDATLTAEAEYSIGFSKSWKKFCLSRWYYNGINSYLFANSVEIYKFKAKDSEINTAPLCLGNISKDFAADEMKKTGLFGYVCRFSVVYNPADATDILDINKYVVVKNSTK